MKGVHSSKSAPIIQDLDYLYGDILNEESEERRKHIKNCQVTLTPLELMPSDYISDSIKKLGDLGLIP